jgi:hypothetical protein
VGLELTEGLKRWEVLSGVLAGTMRNDRDWNTIAQAAPFDVLATGIRDGARGDGS